MPWLAMFPMAKMTFLFQIFDGSQNFDPGNIIFAKFAFDEMGIGSGQNDFMVA